MSAVHVVDDPRALDELVARLVGERCVALDAEAAGMFAYRTELCALQIGLGDGSAYVVDPLAVGVEPLAEVLASEGLVKVVHDVSFDARLLGARGLPLRGVRDTAITARFLGEQSTGLAALAEKYLGVRLDKSHQHHDWRKRPFGERELTYLRDDVAHLLALAEALAARSELIEDAIDEEIRYVLASAAASASEGALLPVLRIKGAGALRDDALAVLEELAAAREILAERRDVPPGSILGNEPLVALSQARPLSRAQLLRAARRRALESDDEAVTTLLAAVARGRDRGVPSEEITQALRKDALTKEEQIARKGRQTRLMEWRRLEATTRAVDEQVVLPGHCLRDLVASSPATLDDLARVPGLGAFRVATYGVTLLELLQPPATEAAP